MAIQLINDSTAEIRQGFSDNPVLVKEQRVLKTSEVAEILNLDYDSALKLMKNGVIPSFRLGKQYRTSFLSCLRFIDDCLNDGKDIKTLL